MTTMVREKISALRKRIEDRLRRLCEALSPDKRIVVTLSLLSVLTALSLYFMVSSIYHIGKGDDSPMRIRHIERLKLEDRANDTDSINPRNDFNYGNERETE